MRRNVLRAALATIVTVAATGAASAQATTTGGVGVGYTDLGGVIGIGGLGGADFSIGGRFERVFKQLPDLGDGYLGFGVSVDWYTYNDRFVGVDYDFTYVPIGAYINYHFNIKSNKKVDPFLGAGLGYEQVNTKYADYDSGIYFITRAGLRYFFSPKTAFYVDAGVGASALNVGLTFALSGGR